MDMAKTILIVEDNKLLMQVYNSCLEPFGYSILQASDGEEAIELASGATLDLVIMDIMLPGMSGIDVTRKLKALPGLEGVPIIAVTTQANIGDAERIKAAGCDAYVAKPINVDQFIGKVQEFLKRG